LKINEIFLSVFGILLLNLRRLLRVRLRTVLFTLPQLAENKGKLT
jgi:hypothetical protein